MKKEKNDFIAFLHRNLKDYKKYQNEIIKVKSEDKIQFQREFLEALNNYDNYMKKNDKQIINENKEKILKFIIMGLLAEKANKTVETTLDSIELIATNNYYKKEIIEKYINIITNNFFDIYNNYKANVPIIVKATNLIKVMLESESFDLKNGSLYDVLSFLLLNIIQLDNSDNRTSTYQIRKAAKSVLDKYIDLLITKSSKINFDLDNNQNLIQIYFYYSLLLNILLNL